MTTTKVSSKGQVVIPKAVRQAHGWKAGVELVVEDAPDGVFLRSTRTGQTSTVDEVVGCIRYRGPRKSVREMDEAVVREARRRR